MASATTETKKVGKNKGKSVESTEIKSTESGRRGPPKKADFDLSTAVDGNGKPIPLDDKERLTAVPANWTNKTALIGRRSFANKALYLDYCVMTTDHAIVRLSEKREMYVEMANEARSGKVSRKRQINKLEKLKAQIAELEASLADDGVEV